MSRTSRILVALASLLLVGMFFLPLWSVRLSAPQYPEGLGMNIHLNDVRGVKEFDLPNINGLNHYIGMKTIEPDAIPELRFMPWIVGVLIASGLAVAAWGRRRPLFVWMGAFALLGVAGLADFWRWEYDYGHNLAPDAIIRIPGQSYQPPLIGSKALLNFVATSWPGPGGWLAGAAFLLGAVALVLAWRRPRAPEPTRVPLAVVRGAVATIALLALGACSTGPRPIAYGHAACEYCRMVISDPRYGAELKTNKGKVLTFDSIECLAAYYAQAHGTATVRAAWVSDFAHPGTLVPAEQARFVRVSGPASPMGKGLTAFAPEADSAALERTYGGEPLTWKQVLALVAREGMPSGGDAGSGRDAG